MLFPDATCVHQAGVPQQQPTLPPPRAQAGLLQGLSCLSSFSKCLYTKVGRSPSPQAPSLQHCCKCNLTSKAWQFPCPALHIPFLPIPYSLTLANAWSSGEFVPTGDSAWTCTVLLLGSFPHWGTKSNQPVIL